MFQNKFIPRIRFIALDDDNKEFKVSLPLHSIDLIEECENNTCLITSKELGVTYLVKGDFEQIDYLVNGFSKVPLN